MVNPNTWEWTFGINEYPSFKYNLTKISKKTTEFVTQLWKVAPGCLREWGWAQSNPSHARARRVHPIAGQGLGSDRSMVVARPAVCQLRIVAAWVQIVLVSGRKSGGDVFWVRNVSNPNFWFWVRFLKRLFEKTLKNNQLSGFRHVLTNFIQLSDFFLDLNWCFNKTPQNFEKPELFYRSWGTWSDRKPGNPKLYTRRPSMMNQPPGQVFVKSSQVFNTSVFADIFPSSFDSTYILSKGELNFFRLRASSSWSLKPTGRFFRPGPSPHWREPVAG